MCKREKDLSDDKILQLFLFSGPGDTPLYWIGTLFLICDKDHPPGIMKGFIKGEALRFFRSNSSKEKFEEHIALFKQRLRHRVSPDNLLNMTLSKVLFSERMSALQNKQILPFATEYRLPVPNLKIILMNK